jgi:hypothetical protein
MSTQPSTLPTSQWCPIGSLNLHTYNHERTECIWCGPNCLSTKPGRWVSQGDGTSAWSVEPDARPEGDQ